MMRVPTNLGLMMTKAEVSQRLQVSIKTIERWMASGELPVHRFGKSVRISADDYRVFVDRGRN